MADTVAENDRRSVWVVIQDRVLLDALSQPKDTRIVATHKDLRTSYTEILIEGDSLPVVPKGCVVPRIAPEAPAKKAKKAAKNGD